MFNFLFLCDKHVRTCYCTIRFLFWSYIYRLKQRLTINGSPTALQTPLGKLTLNLPDFPKDDSIVPAALVEDVTCARYGGGCLLSYLLATKAWLDKHQSITKDSLWKRAGK